MRVGSLFSGIGGLDLGLERAGMEIVWQVEFEPFCQTVLRKHWPESEVYGDIKKIEDFGILPGIDLICGGFPCQPISSAGRQRGSEDERWLWPEYLRAIRQARPGWVLAENVPRLLSADNGRLMGGILRDLAGLGYDAEWCLLPTGIGHGHLRYRLFIVGHPQGGGLDSPRIFSRKHIKGYLRERGSLDPGEHDKETWAVPAAGNVRDVNGFVPGMDRYKAIGNAVVPDVAEWIGRWIMHVRNVWVGTNGQDQEQKHQAGEGFQGKD